MPQSVYIHIPFCKSKCNYCSFVSFEDYSKKKGYIYSLLKEIDINYKGEKLKTLYIGGGTPSLLTIDELKLIVSKFNLEDDCEFTIEVNPNDPDECYLLGLKGLGVNRLSIGVQTFDDELLKIIGRRHTSAEAVEKILKARETGFENINVDLIYGLPNQTIKGFESDLKRVLDLGVQHISLYGLKIEKGCKFYKNMPDNLPEDDNQADMYLLAGEVLKNNGYEHYEVSNFSKSGFNSKHNRNYWLGGEYYGFGVAAHGFVDGVRYSNYTKLDKYMDAPDVHEFGKFMTERELLEEKIFLGLRLADGIDVAEINKRFNIDFEDKYKDTLGKYAGYLLKTEKGYCFSDNKDMNGFLISNIVLRDFM